MSGRFRTDLHYSRSSFARSFFTAGTGDTDDLSEENGEDAPALVTNANVPVPKFRPPLPLQRRASSRGAANFRSTSIGSAVGGTGGNGVGGTIAENNDFNNSNNSDDMNHSPVPMPADVDRSNSWYADAVNNGLNLDELLGASTSSTTSAAAAAVANEVNSPDPAFGDEEVLEQYRIMAQHEAMLRVKENTGFDPGEYEKRRKLHPPDSGRNSTKKSMYGGGKKPQSRLPQVKKISPSNITLKLEEPPMPPPRVNNYFLQQAGLRVPELCAGVPVRGSSTSVVSKEDHVVRCLGCRNQLRVKVLATLVSCPDCNTVSPASSTRR